MLRVTDGCEKIARYAAACMWIGDDAVRSLVHCEEPLHAEKLASTLNVPFAAAVDVLHSDYRFHEDASGRFCLSARNKLSQATRAPVLSLLYASLYWRGIPMDISDLVSEACCWQERERTSEELVRIMSHRRDFVRCGDRWLLRRWLGQEAQFEPGYVLTVSTDGTKSDLVRAPSLAEALYLLLSEVKAPVPFERLYTCLRAVPHQDEFLTQTGLLKTAMSCNAVVFLRNGHFALADWLISVKKEFCSLSETERRKRQDQLLDLTLAYHAEGDRYSQLLSRLQQKVRDAVLHDLSQGPDRVRAVSDLDQHSLIESEVRERLGVLQLSDDETDALVGRIESEVKANLRAVLRREGVLFLDGDRITLVRSERVQEVSEMLLTEITGIGNDDLCRRLWPAEVTRAIPHGQLSEYLQKAGIEYTDGYWHAARERMRGLVAENLDEIRQWLSGLTEPASTAAVVARALPVAQGCPEAVVEVARSVVEDVCKSARGIWSLSCGDWWASAEELATAQRVGQLKPEDASNDEVLEQTLSERFSLQLQQLIDSERQKVLDAFRAGVPLHCSESPSSQDAGVPDERSGDDALEPVPPRTSKVTLTEDMLSDGFLGLAPGATQIFQEHFGDLKYARVVKMAVEGHYGMTGWVTHQGRRLVSEALMDWLSDRDAAIGDQVIFHSPIPPEETPRLSLETVSLPGSRRGGDRGRKLQLRERIQASFVAQGHAMDVDTLVELLGDASLEHVKRASVAAALSANDHVFALWGRAVWGLREWADDWTDFVNLQLLAWRIEDEDLVFRVVEEAGAPLSTRQIVHEIAQRFDVRVERVGEVTLPIREDPRLRYDERTRLVSLTAWSKEPCPLLTRCIELVRERPGLERRVAAWFASRWSTSLAETLREYDISVAQEDPSDELH